jgi:hypothetical protein
MTISVLVDTSFLISLVDARRPHHATARSYYTYCLGNDVRLYLSALVAAEFSVKQPIGDLGLHNYVPLPFNLPDGVVAGDFIADMTVTTAPDTRVAVRIDLMLLAQAKRAGVRVILSEDKSTLAKFCSRLREKGMLDCYVVLLSDGFDPERLADPGSPTLRLPFG